MTDPHAALRQALATHRAAELAANALDSLGQLLRWLHWQHLCNMDPGLVRDWTEDRWWFERIHDALT